MWYFSWILGVGVALAAGVISALWFESREDRRTGHARPDSRETLAAGARGAT
jgi:cytochrome bd-I ubiquinol oxidase subunit X